MFSFVTGISQQSQFSGFHKKQQQQNTHIVFVCEISSNNNNKITERLKK